MAFPTTSTVLDNFNRTNGAVGSAWSLAHNFAGGTILMQILSNQCKASNDYNIMYWNATTYGPDAEAYVLMPVITTITLDGPYLCARLTNPGASLDGYLVGAESTSWFVGRMDNGVLTRLGSNIAVTPANGDSLGIDCVGSTIAIYRKNSGNWSQLATRSDSTYSAAGYLGLYGGADDQNYRLDDFGGGTVVSGGTQINVTDGSTVGDATPTATISSATINKTDGTTVGDASPSVTSPAAALLSTNTIDGATVGDALPSARLPTALVNTTDVTTVGDATPSALLPNALVSQSENVTVGEAAPGLSITDIASLGVNKSDDTVVGDTPSAVLASALAVDKSDGVSLGETAASVLTSSLLAGATDTTAVGDSTGVLTTGNLLIVLSDGTTVADSVVAQITSNLLVALSDDTAVGDTLLNVSLPEIGSVTISVLDTANLGDDVVIEAVAMPTLGIAIDPDYLQYWINGVKVVG
jgi:hypothetical protein